MAMWESALFCYNAGGLLAAASLLAGHLVNGGSPLLIARIPARGAD
jgi:hypothetical protein